MKFLISTAYLPNLDQFAILSQAADSVYIEAAEFFVKQSYRNRAYVLSPNGVLALTIPIKTHSKHGIAIKEVEISYAFDWQRLHFKTLETCYRNAPYFEFFEEDIRSMYEQKNKWLFDYNMSWISLLFQMAQISKAVSFKETSSYEHNAPEGIVDLRNRIHPKKRPLSVPQPYAQVFSSSAGFESGLSFLDLLLNEGRQAKTLLPAIFSQVLECIDRPLADLKSKEPGTSD